MKKGQIALEYIFIHGFALLLLIGLLATILVVESRANEDVRIQQAQEIAKTIQQELVLATSVHHGYTRTIQLPENIQSYPYTIELAQTAVFVSVDDYQAIQPIPRVNGTMNPGVNTITNTNGEVQVY